MKMKILFSILIISIFLLVGCEKRPELPPPPGEPNAIIGKVIDLNQLPNRGNFVAVSPDPLLVPNPPETAALTVSVTDHIILKRFLVFNSRQGAYQAFEFDAGNNHVETHQSGEQYLMKDSSNSAPITVTKQVSLSKANLLQGSQNAVLVFSCTKEAARYNCHGPPGIPSDWLARGFSVTYASSGQDIVLRSIVTDPAVPLRDDFTKVDIRVDDLNTQVTGQPVKLFVDFEAGDADTVSEVRIQENGPNIDANGDGRVGFGHEGIGEVTIGTPRSFWIKIPNENPIRIRAIADPTNAPQHRSVMGTISPSVTLTAFGDYQEPDEISNNTLLTPNLPAAKFHSDLRLLSSNVRFNMTPIVGKPAKLIFNITDESDLRMNNGRSFVPLFSFGNVVTKTCAGDDTSCSVDLDTDNDGIVGGTTLPGTTVAGLSVVGDKTLGQNVNIGTQYTLHVVFGDTTTRTVRIFIDPANSLNVDSKESPALVTVTPILTLPDIPLNP